MTRRPVLLALGALALAAIVVVGLLQTRSGGDTAGDAPVPSLAEARARLAGAPAPLAAVHRQANTLVPADEDAFRARLRELRGYPVVVNKWASWCAPCRYEFPVFQRVSAELGRRVAFLGLNSKDNDAPAERFLREHPVSYPSVKDPDTRLAQALQAALAYPSTIFFDARGEQCYTHQGQYTDDADLRSDIARYATGRCR